MSIKSKIKHYSNKLLSGYGYHIDYLNNGFSMNRNLNWLEKYGIRTIFDIGANEGQFVKFIRAYLPNALIYSFEPLPSCFMKLEQLSLNIDNMRPMNFAIGEENGTIDINVNEFSPSSSILEMKEKHLHSFPFANKSKKTSINVRNLDSLYKELSFQKNLMVKIDVQGYEGKVLEGGKEFFSLIPNLVIVESSIIQLYEGEPSFHYVYEYFKEKNFKYLGNLNQLYDPNDGEILQADLIFGREE